MKLLSLAICLFTTTAVAAPSVTSEELGAEGVIAQEGAVMVLQSYKGDCKNGKRAILMLNENGMIAAFVGCWRIDGDVVASEWEDGDKYRVPVNAHQWAQKRGGV